MRSTASASTSAAAAPGPLDHREQHAVALLELVARQAGLPQKPFERLRRSVRARALHFLAARLGRLGDVARDQHQPPRRRVRIGRAGRQPRLARAFGEQPREVVARLRLHPRRDFLGQEFQKEVAHSSLPSRERRGPPRSGGRVRGRDARARRPLTRLAPLGTLSRKGRGAILLHPRRARRLGEVAHAADIGLALGDRDHAARLERVEQVARLDRLLIGGDRELRFDAQLAFRGGFAEHPRTARSVFATSKL